MSSLALPRRRSPAVALLALLGLVACEPALGERGDVVTDRREEVVGGGPERGERAAGSTADGPAARPATANGWALALAGLPWLRRRRPGRSAGSLGSLDPR